VTPLPSSGGVTKTALGVSVASSPVNSAPSSPRSCSSCGGSDLLSDADFQHTPWAPKLATLVSGGDDATETACDGAPDVEDEFVAMVDDATMQHALWRSKQRHLCQALRAWRTCVRRQSCCRKLGRTQTKSVSLSAFIKQEGAPAEQIVTTSSTATQGAATADNSILEGLVQECKGRRVDPSDGRFYDFASFRSCYGSDALRLWRRAGALAEQRAKADRARFRRKVHHSFGRRPTQASQPTQARPAEKCPYDNPYGLLETDVSPDFK
jgi:hypothetical protein